MLPEKHSRPNHRGSPQRGDLKKEDLTLETTVAKCRAQEAAKKQRAEIAKNPNGGAQVQAIQRQRNNIGPAGHVQGVVMAITREVVSNVQHSTENVRT